MGLSNYLPSSRISQSGVCTSTTRPASPFEGQVIYETDTDRVLVWNASAWVAPNSTTANPPGLELVKTQTVGAGVTSVTVTDAFSANYANYRITYTGGVLSASTNINMVLGAAATGYYNQLIYATYAGVGPISNVPDNNAVRWNFVGSGTTTFANVLMEIQNPFDTTRTLMTTAYRNETLYGTGGGFLDDATSYSAFTLGLGTGTMTGGTIRVYGYRN
jgi:hypothetical protein